MKRFMRDIWQALVIVWQSSRKWTILSICSQLIQALLPIGLLYLIKLIVDLLTAADTENILQLIGPYIAIYGLLLLLQAIIQNYQQLINESQQQQVSDYLATKIIDKASRIEYAYYEQPEYHDILHQTQRQAMYRPVQVVQSMTEILRSGLLLLSLAGLLLYLHWSIAILLLILGLPLAIVKWYYSKKRYNWEREQTQQERKAYYLTQVLTGAEYAKEVRLFQLNKKIKASFIALRRFLFKGKLKIGQQKAQAGMWAKTTEIIALLGVFSFVIWRTSSGLISIGDLVMYLQAFQKGQASTQLFLGASIALYNNRLFLQYLFTFLQLNEINSPTNSPLCSLQKAIKLEQVSFSYPNVPTKVLQDITLELKKGQVIALVGENGSGKTSLIKLLCRLYSPDNGHIYWDNTDIKQISHEQYWKRVSAIFQDFSKYEFTIEENILTGKDTETNMQLYAAAKASGALSFIEQFPLQFQQQLGRQFIQGTDLSGGQWQKIALTRALYKSADLIILDEPSSAIDPLAEATIFEAFRKLAPNRILVLVTHRLYNLKIADQIIVLHEGKVAEQGTHEELMLQRGHYYQMFSKQS